MPNHTLILLFSAFLSATLPSAAQNDKQVLGDAVFTPNEIAEGAAVTFLVRFQNFGQDTAVNLAIRDTLDPRFDANTFQMLDASHDYQVLQDQGFVRWYFNGIMLPANHNANQDFANSAGYILYSVQLQRFLTPGQTILNHACITFDDEPTICTNDAAVWIDQGALAPEPGDPNQSGYSIVPNPNYGHFEVRKINPKPSEPGETVSWWISDMNGKTIWDGSSQDLAAAPNEVMLERPAPGLYMLWMKNNGALQVEQFAVIR
jgi:hypothetical protein